MKITSEEKKTLETRYLQQLPLEGITEEDEVFEMRDFSAFDNWEYREETTNMSTIIDRLLRITTKVTERYASDIYYDVKNLVDVVTNGTPFCRVLVFRENGVTSYYAGYYKTEKWIRLGAKASESSFSEAIQIWVLQYLPNNGDGIETMLKRVECRGKAKPEEVLG